jgi:preprotein translocase subunit YajC
VFITPAFAQASGASALGSTDMLIQFAPFAVVLGIMYFLVLRPQQQKAKDQRAMIQAAKRGDTIVTTGGLIGKITKSTDDNEVEVEIAPNVKVRLTRSGIADVRAKGEPVKEVTAAK